MSLDESYIKEVRKKAQAPVRSNTETLSAINSFLISEDDKSFIAIAPILFNQLIYISRNFTEVIRDEYWRIYYAQHNDGMHKIFDQIIKDYEKFNESFDLLKSVNQTMNLIAIKYKKLQKSEDGKR